MKILVDTHCHTLACDHAFSTVGEIALDAKEKGMEMVAITDHAPAMSDSPHEWHFSCMKFLPRQYKEIYILRGAEANIIDYNGGLDLPQWILKDLDIIIASLHEPCMKPGTIEENTNAVLKCIENEYVTIVGHIGNPAFAVNYEEIVDAVLKHHKLIEINNHSFKMRKGSAGNCEKVARLCMERGASIVVSSDAHFAFMVGELDEAQAMLDGIGFPEELVQNTTAEKLLNFLKAGKNFEFEVK